MRTFRRKKEQLQKNEVPYWLSNTNAILGILGFVASIIIGLWGIRLTYQANENREQIDTLTSMVKELRQQNNLLQKSVAIQENEFKTYTGEIKYSKRPQLIGVITVGEVSEASVNNTVQLTNFGGDIVGLRYHSLNGVVIDSATFPKNGYIPTKASFDIRFLNIQDHSGVRLFFKDALNNKYSQDLTWIKKDNDFDFQLGILNEVR